MGKELNQVKNKIQKLLFKKALIDEELEPLFMQEKELEDQEIIVICRKNNITIEDLMNKVNKDKENKKVKIEKEKASENYENEK
ncbi:conjugal transfer protein [Lacrimispora amygdalina]|uniref:Conjugal transfer protein n=1 Tax=Lacrimispora amygdalina TaxID=253257 RepID=A0A3E2N631_9FIRM|nr:conjugal transfer protein [Clostridium indicum]RFZ76457.1 conjugal transfer protein [Clostridium indicum]